MFKKGTDKQEEAAAVERQAQTMVSCIGSGMTIVGKVECPGPAQVFGKIEGELRATELVIGEGAEVDGTIEAEDVTISGHVKGTIRAIRVRLQGATVEGEIVHRTLSMDESSVFEGNSRRVENPVERRGSAESSKGADKSLAKAVMPRPTLAPSAPPSGNGAMQPY